MNVCFARNELSIRCLCLLSNCNLPPRIYRNLPSLILLVWSHLVLAFLTHLDNMSAWTAAIQPTMKVQTAT